jgi:hypothetical protein
LLDALDETALGCPERQRVHVRQHAKRAALVYASLVYASLVYASLVYASLVYASLVYASLVYASLVYASLMYASLVVPQPTTVLWPPGAGSPGCWPRCALGTSHYAAQGPT